MKILTTVSTTKRNSYNGIASTLLITVRISNLVAKLAANMSLKRAFIHLRAMFLADVASIFAGSVGMKVIIRLVVIRLTCGKKSVSKKKVICNGF